ncbi:MAG: YdcH family protein [Pseudonocardiaceae bacterium]
MTEVEIESLKQHIITLQVEHHDLDDVISRLGDRPEVDELELRRLKKRKLYLKDHIFTLEKQLTPDIPA